MINKIAEVMFYSENIGEGVNFNDTHPKTKEKYINRATAALLAIDKLNFCLCEKAAQENADKDRQTRLVKIEELLKEEIQRVSFLKREFPKVSPDFWKELTIKICALC